MPHADDQIDSTGRRWAHNLAPGKPGSAPTWSPAAKSGVGCAISGQSHIWFTVGRGIVNEVYHPWIDHAAIRDMAFMVSGPDGYVCEEGDHYASDTQTTGPGIPCYHVRNECASGRVRIFKEIFTDPDRDVLIQRTRFEPIRGALADYRLYVLLSPRLGDQGENNCGWVGHFHGTEMLFAKREGHSLALASSAPWTGRSVGYVGVSDLREDLHQHREMTWHYDRAEHGHIMLAGEVDLSRCHGEFVLALGIDRSPEAAALNASLSLMGDLEDAKRLYVEQWREWQKTVTPLDRGRWSKLVSANAQQRNRPDSSRPKVNGFSSSERNPHCTDLYRTSMMVLRVHKSKQFAGASVASLAVPWGEARGDKDLGGYHLVWPRDLVEECGGFLAGGAHDEARCVLDYLRATQKTTGGWAQDMWLDGSPYAGGEQTDEAALPILLVALARREKAIDEATAKAFWPLVRSAAGFVVRTGPWTGQSRWENTPGLSPYTIATEIAALVVAARMAEEFGEPETAVYLRQTADLWNDLIDEWTYVRGTEIARDLRIEGYYIRIAPSPGMSAFAERGERPRLSTSRDMYNADVVSPDALALVRFGLRAADDPRIVNTIRAIDAINRAETPAGPCWRRYTGGYYGESDRGEPFTGGKDKSGHGRAWPLLTGERGHLELAAGNIEAATHMLATMGGLSSQIGLLPEQVWDKRDIPEHHLFCGRPAGSAMPLAWTHAEYVRLLRSLHDGQVFDMPAEAHERYVKRKTGTDLALWRFDHQVPSFRAGRRLRIEVHAPAIVHFTTDQWQSARDISTRETGVELQVVDLPTEKMNIGERLIFTFRWPKAGDRWEGRDFEMVVRAGKTLRLPAPTPLLV